MTDIPAQDPSIPSEFDIKEEFSLNIEEDNIEFKTEAEEPESSLFEETEIQIKEELAVSIEQEDSQSSADVKDEETETILPTSTEDLDVKVEAAPPAAQESSAVYEYPSYDDSMDSSEAAALSHVEACLTEELTIKVEDDVYHATQKDFPRVIKEESGLTVTETHLISNKVINTTSTITNTIDGIIESQTTKTLVMEIHPMTQQDGTFKIGNPEEILPTQNETIEMEFDPPYHLNSITGNFLSLEQEAYGLLKTNKKKYDKMMVCPKCPKTLADNTRLKRHLKVHEGIENREKGLKKGLKTRLEKKQKMKVEEKVEVETKSLKKKLLKSEETVKIEKGDDKKGDAYKCTCGNAFRRRSRMETCLRSHTEYASSSSYSCPTCDQKFKSKDLLIFHRQRQHRKKFPCKFCPTDYNTQKELFRHLRVHQKVQLTEFKVISEVAKGDELQCLLCTMTCSKLSDFKTHIMEGHAEPYNCPHCNQVFTKLVDIANHIKKIHPDVGSQSVLDVLEAFSKLVKAWKCDTCGKQFHKADKLALHQVEEHTPDMKNEQHFQCGDCQRVFISKSGLNSHMRMHHRTAEESAEEPEPEEVGVLCLECRKVCQDMNHLTSHMRLHSMERRYPCKYCDFRFATPQKRKAHAEIHTGDMKYVCFICEYTCSSENRLKQHKMSIKHLNMKEYLLTGKPLIEEEDTSAKKQKIKDTLKDKEWGVKKKKKDRKEKEDEREIACDICGEKFGTESEMQDHKQTHPFIEFPNDDKPSRIFFK